MTFGCLDMDLHKNKNRLKPVYVFDGKPPTMKGGELAKRSERRAEANAGLMKAQQEGNADDVEKFTKRLTKVLSLPIRTFPYL